MNLLREVRRVKEKNMATRIRLLLTFSVIFIVTTYAWFSKQKNVTLGGLTSELTSWDITYVINGGEILNETAVFTIDEFYPGMPEREDNVYIYNKGEASSVISYELVSVKVFGQEVLSELQTTGEIQTSGNTTNLFSKETQYPFNVSYTYDRTKLIGIYEDDETTPQAVGNFKFKVNWAYEGQGNATENLAKDVLDTKFGKDAYEYYQDEANDPTKAIEIIVKITSRMIHPKDDPDYVEP